MKVIKMWFLFLGLVTDNQCFGIKTWNQALLQKSTEMLMTLGGDDRLDLSLVTGYSKYHTAPRPADPRMLIRSSCTSSFVDNDAFSYVQQVHQQLRDLYRSGELGDNVFNGFMGTIRQRLQTFFGIEGSYITCLPSGTDVERLVTFLALAKHPDWVRRAQSGDSGNEISPLVLTIILANNEVGSKSLEAACCLHTSSTTPCGESCISGESIDPALKGVIAHQIFDARGADGRIISSDILESELEKRLETAIVECNQIVVLHGVFGSKTGLFLPRYEFLKAMKERYRDSLVIVIDSAQLRCEKIVVQRCLHDGMNVLITGGKFFGGASYSGALLVPASEGSIFVEGPLFVPAGFGKYINAFDVDECWSALREQLPLWRNYGLLLRWYSALFIMEKFYSYHESERVRVIQAWCDHVSALIESFPGLQLLQDDLHASALLAQRNTILSIKVCPFALGGEIPLSYGDIAIVYQLMRQDISELCTLIPLSPDEQLCMAHPCLLGQPVIIVPGASGVAVLRIALSAPMVCAMLETVDGIDRQLREDRIMVQKLALIARYLDELREALAARNR